MSQPVLRRMVPSLLHLPSPQRQERGCGHCHQPQRRQQRAVATAARWRLPRAVGLLGEHLVPLGGAAVLFRLVLPLLLLPRLLCCRLALAAGRCARVLRLPAGGLLARLSISISPLPILIQDRGVGTAALLLLLLLPLPLASPRSSTTSKEQWITLWRRRVSSSVNVARYRGWFCIHVRAAGDGF